MILISAGHNPINKGAAIDDFNEHDEAVLWSLHIVSELESLDVAAMIVPTGSLTKKIAYINQVENVVCTAEIHFNSAVYKGKQVGKGSETLYCPGSNKGEALAKSVQKYLSPTFLPNRGVKEGWYGMDRPGHEDFPGDVDGDEKPDAFLVKTKCPAIIIEPQFIQYKEDIQHNRLTGSKLITYGIIEGIETWQ